MALAHCLIIKWMKGSLVGLKNIHLKDIQINRISIPTRQTIACRVAALPSKKFLKKICRSV